MIITFLPVAIYRRMSARRAQYMCHYVLYTRARLAYYQCSSNARTCAGIPLITTSRRYIYTYIRFFIRDGEALRKESDRAIGCVCVFYTEIIKTPQRGTVVFIWEQRACADENNVME